MKRALLIAVSLLITLSCNGDKAPTTPATPFVPPVISTGISVSPLVQSIPPGQTARLTVTARYSDGSTRDVTSQATWTSSQASVATVSAGAVTGVALGRTMIRVNFERWNSSMTIVIQPDGTFVLKGKVTEAGQLAVSGATVEAIDGPPAQMQTNSAGLYELFGMAGTFIMRFGKTGYFDERRTVTMTADQSLDVEITPRAAPAGVAGVYRATFTGSASCTNLPANLRTRTYTARIDQDGARLMITLSDASFVTARNTFSGRVSGDSVMFDLGTIGSYFPAYAGFPGYYTGVVQETLPGSQILAIWGSATASATAQSISGTLAGGFALLNSRQSTSCAGTDNQVVFTRQ